jgi:hypothetical protein
MRDRKGLTREQCSGDNPCQRCIDNGKRCFYSEDQTAAEVLQNLSRPTHAPASQPSFSNTKSNNNSNSNNSNSSGNGASRLNVIPQNGASERRPSDTGVGGLTMEERMARMEAMLEMLMQERGMTFPPNGGLEREESVGFRSESAFPLPLLDPIHPALEQMTQHSSEQMQHTLLAEDAAFASDASSFVRAGNQNLPFPDSARYQQYVSQFFIDLFPRHPCIDQADFASRTQRIITDGATETSDIYFLALCYAIFACCDAVPQMHDAAASSNDKPPGWHWYQLADSLVDAKKELQSSCEVLAPMQSFLFQVRFRSLDFCVQLTKAGLISYLRRHAGSGTCNDTSSLYDNPTAEPISAISMDEMPSKPGLLGALRCLEHVHFRPHYIAFVWKALCIPRPEYEYRVSYRLLQPGERSVPSSSCYTRYSPVIWD